MLKTFYIETYGCQMNVYDSAGIAALLEKEGLEAADSVEHAGVILINSCAVRGHAEERVLGRVGELKSLKSQNPDLKLVLCGCVAQEQGQALLQRFPHLDAVVGTSQYRQLPAIVAGLASTNGRPCLTSFDHDIEDLPELPDFSGQATAFVAVMRGCNNFCSYCIVPYVRGRERSRPADDIINEIRQQAERGVKEVTLVGQNVNSYKWQETDFPRLLETACSIQGIERIRFITSHPKDLSDGLIRVMSENHKICKHLHLPLQAGSDRILKLMNRGYTIGHFESLAERARRAMPDLTLTTDVIAGFPGETEAEFSETLEAMERIRFDGAFTYKYSGRPGTKAAELSGEIGEGEKLQRLDKLIKLQQQITLESNRADIGKIFEVLVEKESKKSNGQFMGRTGGNKTTVFDSPSRIKTGDLVNVRIIKATQATLVGEII
jgi:tRNA-2-methylthio-N6-dimethylallyladenosine synthase